MLALSISPYDTLSSCVWVSREKLNETNYDNTRPRTKTSSGCTQGRVLQSSKDGHPFTSNDKSRHKGLHWRSSLLFFLLFLGV